MPFRWRRTKQARHEPTDAERAAFDEMLLGEDLEGAEVRAYDYALRLTGKNPTMARQLVKQARTRLWERCSWNPKSCPLGAYLCGAVRSIWSTEARRAVNQRETEVEYLTELDPFQDAQGVSPEDMHVAREESLRARDQAARELAAFKAHFEESGDQVNVLWIEYALDGVDGVAEMVARSGLRPEDFYRAHDRRVRYVERLKEKKTEKK
jgi:DNA-directed RNA polymerase specialized sigma24 family protein